MTLVVDILYLFSTSVSLYHLHHLLPTLLVYAIDTNLIVSSYSLKVVFFGDNVPKERADKAMEAAKGCDAFLVLGSSLMTMSAFRLARYNYLVAIYACSCLLIMEINLQ